MLSVCIQVKKLLVSEGKTLGKSMWNNPQGQKLFVLYHLGYGRKTLALNRVLSRE